MRAVNNGDGKKVFGPARQQGNRSELVNKVGVSADPMKTQKEIGQGGEEGVLVRSEKYQDQEHGKEGNSDLRKPAPHHLAMWNLAS